MVALIFPRPRFEKKKGGGGGVRVCAGEEQEFLVELNLPLPLNCRKYYLNSLAGVLLEGLGKKDTAKWVAGVCRIAGGKGF